MKRTEMNRRDFTRLTAAAFGGVVAGTMAGCGEQAATNGGGEGAAPAGGEAAAEGSDAGSGTAHDHDHEHADGEAGEHDVANMMGDVHVCRGLNMCKGQGQGGGNACAGQGACATAEAHSCHAANACKGQGGCGDFAGQNACKGQGECNVPLREDTWVKARAAFEKAMKAAGKDVGPAPAAG